MIAIIKNDILKLKRTSALYITLFCGFILPLIGALIVIKYVDNFVTEPWVDFTWRAWQPSGLLITLFIVIIISLVVNVEHSSNTWKLIYTQPKGRLQQNISKYIISNLLILSMLVVYTIGILIYGVIIGLLKPSLELINTMPSFSILIIMVIKMYLACLGIISMQFWLSMRLKNIFIPLAIGVVFFAVSNMLGGWEYNYLITYVSPRLVVFETFTKNEIVYGLSKSLYVNLIIFVVISVLSQIDLKKRDII